jgi:hypothetical protein
MGLELERKPLELGWGHRLEAVESELEYHYRSCCNRRN